MKDRPILFKGEMVRAILEGRKTQTRRVVKHVETNEPVLRDPRPYKKPCPYGPVGDRLGVRETFMPMPHLNAKAFYRATDRLVGGKWKPSIFMPRALSRITLEITNVRVERLQDISERDARAEGVIRRTDCHRDYSEMWEMADGYHMTPFATDAFVDLWQSINGKDSWAQNAWVWVVEFKQAKGGEV